MTANARADRTAWQTLRRFGPFITPYWVPIGGSFLLLVARAGVVLLKPWPLKFVFDEVLQGDVIETPSFYLVAGVVGLIVAIAFLDGLLTYYQAYSINRAGRTIVYNIRVTLFDHIQRLSLRFHDRKRTGDLLTRVTTDVKALRNMLTESMVQIVYGALMVIGMGAVLLWLDWQLALVALLATPVMFLLLVRFSTRIKGIARTERKREGALASIMQETLAAVRVVRAFNQERATRDKFQNESAASLERGIAVSAAQEQFAWVVDVVRAVISAAVIAYGIQRVVSGAISPGDLYVFVSYTSSFYAPIRAALRQVAKATRALPRAERVVELLDEKEGVVDLSGARPAPPLTGEITFRNVSFRHGAGARALRDVDLTLPAGRTTAIVGPTGAGKSTLTALILRLYDPTNGTVLIGGRNIRDYTLESLRNQISVVFQESVLFRASIAENISYGRAGVSDAEIEAAARAANAAEFIEKMRDGYETVIGERGDTLSGGQRQRIAIARAMIRDAPIVLLDEPLTGLDANASFDVLRSIERLTSGRMAVIVTHDISTAQRADHVVVMEGGRVIQQGTPGELLRTPGRYRQLAGAEVQLTPFRPRIALT